MILPPYNFEGVGDEVVVSGIVVLVLFATGFYIVRKKIRVWTVHPEERENMNSVRESMAEANRNFAPSAPRRQDLDQEQCPVCLTNVQFGIETNCGHLFCGQCWLAYRNHGNYLGAVRCPVCRQQVTLLFQAFSDGELNSAELQEIETRNQLQQEINLYNRRYSGEPRPLLDYIRDLPTISRHLWNEFFSVGGLVYMFRIRIVLCLLAGVIYLVSPLDVIPEAVFGLLGFLDDLFVFLLLAIYLSILYRRYLADRE